MWRTQYWTPEAQFWTVTVIPPVYGKMGLLHNITDVMRKNSTNLVGPTKNIRDLSGKISTEDDKRCQTRGLDFVAQTPKTGSTVREEPQFAHHIFSNAFYPLAWLIHSFCWINSCGLPNFFFKSTVGWINWENPSLVVSLIELWVSTTHGI